MLVRHYMQTSVGEPARCRVIVRDGEVLAEVLAEGMPGSAESDEAEDDFPHGAGVVRDGQLPRWIVRVPGFGYLTHDDTAGPSVVPAVTISEDAQLAFATLRAPTAGEAPITGVEFKQAITTAGVRAGIDTKRLAEIWRAFQSKGDSVEQVVIARGTEPKPGEMGELRFEMKLDNSTGTLETEGGRVNFREQNSVKNVSAGQLLGTWRPGALGTDGVGVDGSKCPATRGKDVPFTPKDNVTTKTNEDGSVDFLSAIDGFLQVKPGNVIAVTDLWSVSGDVDLSSGNIDASGSVIVHGNVSSKFRVTAREDVIIHGEIQDGLVESGGTLSVGQSIIGGDFGHVSAKVLIVAKNTLNAKLSCDGDVRIAESDINSEIECGGRLIATDGGGRLRGGRYKVAGGLVANELGSPAGVQTFVTLPAARSSERSGEQAPTHGDEPTVDVLKRVYPGAQIKIGAAHLNVHDEAPGSRFYYDSESGKIEREPL